VILKYFNKKYFSIIELIATCVVIAILMSIGLGVYRLIITKINETKTISLIRKLEMAMRSYKHETGYYFQQGTLGPLTINETDTEFTHLIDYTAMKSKNEINSSNIVVDVWGGEVEYQCPGDKNTTLFDIGSKGENGTWGDGPDVAGNFGKGDDITNTNM